MSTTDGQRHDLTAIGADTLAGTAGISGSTTLSGRESHPFLKRLIIINHFVDYRQNTLKGPRTDSMDGNSFDREHGMSEATTLRMQLLERRCQVLELEKENAEVRRSFEKTNEKLEKLEKEIERLSGENLELATERDELAADVRKLKEEARVRAAMSWSDQMQMDDERVTRRSTSPTGHPEYRGGPPNEYIDTTRWAPEDQPVRYADDTHFPATNTTFFHGSRQSDGSVIATDDFRDDQYREDTGSPPPLSRNGDSDDDRDLALGPGRGKVSRISIPPRMEWPRYANDLNAIEDLFGLHKAVVVDWGWSVLEVNVATDASTVLRVRDILLRVGWGRRPFLDSAEKVSTAIDLVLDGTRPDFAMPLVMLYNAADTKAHHIAKERGIRGSDPNSQFREAVEALPAALRAVFVLWEAYRRPGWVKDLLIRHQCSPHPGIFEPTWVSMAWSWLHGPGVGVVNDRNGRISVAHSVGRCLWRLVAPRELYRPEGIRQGRWAYPVSAVWRLFACEGLYEAITDKHDMEIATATVVVDPGAEIAVEDMDNVVECARWFAGRGLTIADSERLALYMQEVVRDRAWNRSEGLEYDEAVWVSRWLVNVRGTSVSRDRSNWFAPEWPRWVKPLPSFVNIFPRTTTHLLSVGAGDDDESLRVVLKEGFDILEYIPLAKPTSRTVSPDKEMDDSNMDDSM